MQDNLTDSAGKIAVELSVHGRVLYALYPDNPMQRFLIAEGKERDVVHVLRDTVADCIQNMLKNKVLLNLQVDRDNGPM
jgi:hypothetical protein